MCLELGSVWVDRELRGHGLAQFLINHLLKSLNDKILEIPIIAVVTHDNEPSNKLFFNLGWQRIPLTAKNTNDFNNFQINGVNIFAGWGIPSDVYFYNNPNRFKN